jgi:hypothetical protein
MPTAHEQDPYPMQLPDPIARRVAEMEAHEAAKSKTHPIFWTLYVLVWGVILAGPVKPDPMVAWIWVIVGFIAQGWFSGQRKRVAEQGRLAILMRQGASRRQAEAIDHFEQKEAKGRKFVHALAKLVFGLILIAIGLAMLGFLAKVAHAATRSHPYLVCLAKKADVFLAKEGFFKPGATDETRRNIYADLTNLAPSWCNPLYPKHLTMDERIDFERDIEQTLCLEALSACEE